MSEMESLTMLLSADVEWNDGRYFSVEPYQLFRQKRRPQKNKYLWKVAFNLPLILKNVTLTRGIKKVTLKADLNEAAAVDELLLLPPADGKGQKPQLQITTSTKRPMFGGSIILHVRSNFMLEDFHCVVTTAKGTLLTTRLISMGNTKLKTFDEIVTFEMAPEATFLVWHVDNWGRTISASVTVPIFAHQQGYLDAHPVLEGHNGYTQLTISGEPNSLVLLKATELNCHNRLLKGILINFCRVAPWVSSLPAVIHANWRHKSYVDKNWKVKYYVKCVSKKWKRMEFSSGQHLAIIAYRGC